MNLKKQAALYTAGIVAMVITISLVTGLLMNYITQYINPVTILVVSLLAFLFYTLSSLVYSITLSKLENKETLQK